MQRRRVLAHVTLYNSPESALIAIQSLLDQRGIDCTVLVTDNASTNQLAEKIASSFGSAIMLVRNDSNLGFAAAQNQAARRCLDGGFDYLFLLNPDARIEPDALAELTAAVGGRSEWAGATPLLYRADSALQPLVPQTVDAAGMRMTCSLRHLDRERGAALPEPVFGGSGAALLLKKEAIEALQLDTPGANQALYRIYPQLANGASTRAALFDEAFFAYREDADLAWRAQLLGLGFLYVPTAVGYHVRHVLPEKRAALSPLINAWSVRNRFLMQINNFAFRDLWRCIVPGIIVRNALVLGGVLFVERTSMRALREVVWLMPRALKRRRQLFARPNVRSVARWFEGD